MTNGARLMLSTPPAMIRSASPPRIARAAIATASRPEPHRRFRVTPPELSGKPGEQPGHAREVAIVLAGLVGAAEDDVVELGPVDAGIALDQRPDRDCGEVVGADARQRAAVAADRRPDCVADIGFGHSRGASGASLDFAQDERHGLVHSFQMHPSAHLVKLDDFRTAP